jgi:hypothetical protein
MAEALDLKRFANGFDVGTDFDRLKGPLRGNCAPAGLGGVSAVSVEMQGQALGMLTSWNNWNGVAILVASWTLSLGSSKA